MAARDGGGGDQGQADLEAWLDSVPRPLVATWCGLDAQQLQRLTQRIGVSLGRTVDVRGLLLGMAAWIRAKQRLDAAISPSEDADGGTLLEKKLREEILSLRKRREWVDVRIKQIKAQYVPVVSVQERLKKLSLALLRAGEQLGHRHGPEAQETFNAAIDGIIQSLPGRPKKKVKTASKKKRKKRTE
jgi:hypothetical protein